MQKLFTFVLFRFMVPERIAAMNNSVKLVAVVCDPVERAMAHYRHILNVQGENGNSNNAAYVKLKQLNNFNLFAGIHRGFTPPSSGTLKILNFGGVWTDNFQFSKHISPIKL